MHGNASIFPNEINFTEKNDDLFYKLKNLLSKLHFQSF